jgi:uncharacterized protein
MRTKLVTAIILSAVILSMGLFGCGGDAEPTAAPGEFVWPEVVNIAAAGTPGMTKFVSWSSVMSKDTGMTLMVVPENNPGKRFQSVAESDMFVHAAGKSGARNVTEALDEFATREGGGFPMRIVWINSVAHSAVYVRGDSDIYTLDDIKPGIKWSIWSTDVSLQKVPRAILDWCEVDPDSAVWVFASTTEGANRAVAEGRADIVWFFPTSAYVYEAAAAPHGIRFIDLNAEADPEGAARFRESDAMYVFGIMGDTVVPEARGVWGTIGEKYMISNDEWDADFVYHYVKWLDENFERYQNTHEANKSMTLEKLVNGLETTYVPCHEGLIRYLKEKGVWTEAHDRRQAQNIVILDVYIEAYAEAIALADRYEIEINPNNPTWITHWENYKVYKELPRMAQHQSLEVDAPWVTALGLD